MTTATHRRVSSRRWYRCQTAPIRVASLYLPNGNPVGSDKFAYKFGWIERLERWIEEHLAAEEMFVLGGDFNIIPEPRDARFPDTWTR